jgi:hypothetical protein
VNLHHPQRRAILRLPSCIASSANSENWACLHGNTNNQGTIRLCPPDARGRYWNDAFSASRRIGEYRANALCGDHGAGFWPMGLMPADDRELPRFD